MSHECSADLERTDSAAALGGCANRPEKAGPFGGIGQFLPVPPACRVDMSIAFECRLGADLLRFQL